jgi:hypothetical protein
LAATLAAVLLAGCDDETVNLFLPAEGQIIATDADSVAYPVTDNWNEPSLFSINAIKARDVAGMQAFRCIDGAGLLAWREGGHISSKAFLFFAYYGPDGNMMPAVEILGDFQDREFVGMEDLAVVWTPGGDAVIAFRAEQAEDPLNEDDDESDRVYYTWFRRAYAELPLGPSGEIYGFRQWAEPVDTNVPGTDDNNVDRIFVATNLADGTLAFDTSERDHSPLSEVCTGSRGDTCLGLPFIYLGWVREEAENSARRLEGGFVDLVTLNFTNADVSLIETNPAAGPFDNVDRWAVQTSGRDIAFLWRQYLDEQRTSFQTRLNLARVNDSRDGLEPTVDVTRNAQTSNRSYIWDEDMNWVSSWDLEICRGATRAFVYYVQRTDVTGQTIAENDSLFARAIRLDADAALTNNVSNEVRINTTIDTMISRSTNVWDFYQAEINPFCSPQTNNDVSCVVFKQSLEPMDSEGFNHFVVVYGRVAITDINANPIAVTATESVIFPRLDRNDSANHHFDIPPVLMPAGTASGDCIVFLTANGNHRDDRNDPDYFEEPRLYAYAPMLPDGQSLSGTVEIGSNNPSGPTVGFANYASLDISNSGADDISNVMAVSTPNLAAARNCVFDNDVANPDFVHVFFFEYLRDPDGGKETIWRSRVLDLRADSFGAGVDRFAPVLGQPPARIGTGFNAARFEQMSGDEYYDYLAQLADNGYGDGPYFLGATQKNDLFVAFNEVWGRKADPGFIFCNTFDPDAVLWARASLLSNDYPSPIASHGSPDMIFVPGVDAAGCDQIVGGWVFWIRSIFQPDREENDVDLLQGRRLYDTRMER